MYGVAAVAMLMVAIAVVIVRRVRLDVQGRREYCVNYVHTKVDGLLDELSGHQEVMYCMDSDPPWCFPFLQCMG